MGKNKELEEGAMPEIGTFIEDASGESLNNGMSQQEWLEYLYGVRAELEDHIRMVEKEIEDNEETE